MRPHDVSAPPPVSAQPGVPIDTESTGVVIKEPSFWEKATNQAAESGFLRGFGRFFGAAGDAAGAVGDRVMGETEQAEAMMLLRETHPRWNQEVFLVRATPDRPTDCRPLTSRD